MIDPKIRNENSDNSAPRRRQGVKTENSVGLRILAELETKNRDLAWLAEQASIPLNTLRDYVQKGVTKSEAAVSIARALGRSADWLLTGQSYFTPSHVIDAMTAGSREAGLEFIRDLEAGSGGALLDAIRERGFKAVLDDLQGERPASLATDRLEDVVVIPALATKAAAGDGSFLWGEEVGDGPFRFAMNWLRKAFGSVKPLRLIQVSGDSQLPDLTDGDWAIIDTSKDRVENGLAVVRLDDCLMIKRLHREGHFLQLISRNPIYAPTALDLSKEQDRIQVIGKVVYVFKAV